MYLLSALLLKLKNVINRYPTSNHTLGIIRIAKSLVSNAITIAMVNKMVLNRMFLPNIKIL